MMAFTCQKPKLVPQRPGEEGGPTPLLLYNAVVALPFLGAVAPDHPPNRA